MIKQVKDIIPQKGKIDEIIVKVIEIPEARTVRTKYGMSDVCDVLVGDETGKISLSLWGKKIEKIRVGNVLKITNGWINVWQDIPQLSIGKGKMEILDDETITEVL